MGVLYSAWFTAAARHSVDGGVVIPVPLSSLGPALFLSKNGGCSLSSEIIFLIAILTYVVSCVCWGLWSVCNSAVYQRLSLHVYTELILYQLDKCILQTNMFFTAVEVSQLELTNTLISKQYFLSYCFKTKNFTIWK